MSYRQFLSDSLERAASTFVQTLVVVLFAAGSDVIDHAPWGAALLAGAIAAAVSVLTSLASLPLPTLPPMVDLALRVVKTYIQAFVGALVVSNYINVNWAGAAATALPVALLALLKGLIAMGLPGTLAGPSLLPAPAETPPTVIAPAADAAADAAPAPAPQPGQSFADPGRPQT